MKKKYALFSEGFGRKIKNVVDSFTQEVPAGKSNAANILACYSSPMEITGEWEQDSDALWTCKAKRLWMIGGEYRTRDAEIEIDLYAPCHNAKPDLNVGDRCFAVFRGLWEVVGGSGGSGSNIIQSTLVTSMVNDAPALTAAGHTITTLLLMSGRSLAANSTVVYDTNTLKLITASRYSETFPLPPPQVAVSSDGYNLVCNTPTVWWDTALVPTPRLHVFRFGQVQALDLGAIPFNQPQSFPYYGKFVIYAGYSTIVNSSPYTGLFVSCCADENAPTAALQSNSETEKILKINCPFLNSIPSGHRGYYCFVYSTTSETTGFSGFTNFADTISINSSITSLYVKYAILDIDSYAYNYTQTFTLSV
ncbi:MAG: hypothetical protein LBJ67_02880 [Planctomycetaceae bacterium]|jgi:hypothetical protein|nr:hypothetical protein [Planctomycetaceae bacterium]